MGMSALIGLGAAAVAKRAMPDPPKIPKTPPPPTPVSSDPATRASYEDAQRRRSSAGASSDARGGTLLTGPLGLTDEPDTRRKSILGS